MSAVKIRIHEVSLRDGLQHEMGRVATDAKVALVGRLVGAGVRDIEVTAFFRRRLFPQFADASELMRALPKARGVRYWAFVPNLEGLDRALEAGAEHVVTALSIGGLSQDGRSERETRAGMERLLEAALAQDLLVRTYLSDAFVLRSGGFSELDRVTREVRAFLEVGVEQVVLADTEGVASPVVVQKVLYALREAGVDLERVGLHFHDTRGMASANVLAAWFAGAQGFDSALAGYGGDPTHAAGAGNIPTEELVYLLAELGVEVSADLERLCAAGDFLEELVGRPLPGRMHQHWRATRSRATWSA